jgi:hypothetical protein
VTGRLESGSNEETITAFDSTGFPTSHATIARAMAITLDDVDEFATNLPGVTVGAKWGNRTWMVEDKGFAWQRPFRKSDIERFGDETPPPGDILAVRVESLDAKDALLAIAPRGFFTIPHFNGYPAVLIALRQARAKDVRAAILDAFRTVAASLPARKRSVSRTRKPRGSAPRARVKKR